MTKNEIKSVKANDEPPIKIRSLAGKRGVVKINGKIAIPVEATASYFETALDISVYDETNVEIGTLCFTKAIVGKTWNMLTEDQFIAFLTEAEYIDIGTEYRFKSDYLVLSTAYNDAYLRDYSETSAIWGGFAHKGISIMQSHKVPVNRIDVKKINLNNAVLKESSLRSVLQPFAFERYLKLYHLLELRFDSEIIEEIQALDYQTSPELIAQILNKYNKTETQRLQHIIDKHCTNIPRLVTILDQIGRFEVTAKTIFYRFGKSENPLVEDKFDFLLANGFSEANVKTKNLGSNADQYSIFIRKLVCHWIYRCRSSIAHSKIGEFILGHSDEDFIAEFAEPLLKETIIQCLKV
jgi:hypothetical protein